MISSKNHNSVCVILPFYNEEQSLSKVITKTLQYVDKIILINDGSTDSSVKSIPNHEKVILITHDKNYGKGKALKNGFSKSIELNLDITITLDADGQHDPDYIYKFIDLIKEYDCVIGSRVNDHSSMPIHRKMSNFLTSKLLTWKTGYRIEDSQSGFRAFRTEILNNILPSFNGFEAESEMIVNICKLKYTIGFVNIPTIYGNDNSKMKALPTIIGFIKVMFKS